MTSERSAGTDGGRDDPRAGHATSDGRPAAPSDGARGARRAAYALLATALVAGIASWDRLAPSYTSAECRFVHQGMGLLGMTERRDFGREGTHEEARTLALAMMQVGGAERPVRLCVLLAMAAAAFAVMEAARSRGPLAGAIAAAIFVGRPELAAADAVRPAAIVVLPAALAMLAFRAPGTGRGIVATALAILGGLMATRLDPGAGMTTAVALAVAGAVRAFADRRFARLLPPTLVLAGIVAYLAISPRTLPKIAWSGAEIANFFDAFAAMLPGAGRFGGDVVGGAAALLVAFGSLRGGVGAGRRAATVLAAVAVLAIASGATVDGVPLDPARTAAVLLPLVALALVEGVVECGALLRCATAALVLAGAFAPLLPDAPPPPREDPRTLLAALRAVSSTADVAALSGPARIGAAVYARLGHDPNMRTIYVPEDASRNDLAAAARSVAARVLWSPIELEGVPGLSPPPKESGLRPAPEGLFRYVVESP